MRRTIRFLVYFFVILIILLAILVGIARAFTPVLNQYRPQITEYASNKLHMAVNVDSITGSWHWLEPMLKFKNVSINAADSPQSTLKVQELDVGINLFSSFFHWQLKPGTIFIRGTSLIIAQQSNDKWALSNFNYSTSGSSPNSIITTLFAVNRISVKEVDVRLEPRNSLPITINDANINLLSFGRRHFLVGHFNANRQSKLNVPIELAARFQGDGNNINKLLTRFHLVIQHLSLADWSSLFPLENTDISGNISTFSIDGQAKGLQPSQFNLKFAGENLHILHSKVNKSFVINYISANLFAKHPSPRKWEFSLKHWQFEHNDVMFPTNNATLDWQYQDKNNFTLSGWVDHITLQSLLPLSKIAALRDTVLRQMMMTMKPQGILGQISWSITKKTGTPLSYSLETQLGDLSFQPWQKVPGLTHVNGKLHLNQNKGEAVLNGKNSIGTFPLVFRGPLLITDWSSNVDWQQKENGLYINAKDTYLTTPAGDAKSELSLFVPANSDSTEINLQSTVNILNLSKQDIYGYLPTGILSPPVIKWLDDNLVSVGKARASLTLKGALSDFPFDDGKGVFDIRAEVNDGKLRLSEGWPVASSLTGTLRFLDRSMDIQINSGEINGAHITQARAQIPYMGITKPVILTITGAGNGDASQALTFLHNSPLNAYLKEGLDTVTGNGTVNVNLSLVVPLAQSNTQQPTLNGVAALKNVNLTTPLLVMPIQNLNGNLQFTQSGLFTPGIRGDFLGVPLEIGITSPSPKNQQQTQIKLTSALDLAALQAQYHFPIDLFATGNAPFSAMISISHNGSIHFLIKSMLEGINVNLPLSLRKARQQTMALIIDGSLDANAHSQISFTYGTQAAGSAQFTLSPKFKLQSGNFILGTNVLGAPPASGLLFTAVLPVCSSEVWKNTALQLKPLFGEKTVASKGWPMWLNGITLNCAQLMLSNFAFSNATLKVTPLPIGLAVNIQSKEAAGTVNVPLHNTKQPMRINMQHLRLSANKSTSASSLQAINPSLLPRVNFIIRDLQYNQKKIGDITGSLQPQTNGALITTTISQRSALNAQLKTQWMVSPSASTTLTGSLSSANTSQALKNMGFPSNLKSQNATANFALKWKGAPYQMVPVNLNGTVNIVINDGTIVGLDKSTDAAVGFGRILTILSLQALPDTLRSGFSSVGTSGFNFTKINSAFLVQNGNALIQEGTLTGRIAGVNLTGNLNLVNQTYQMLMTVTPHVTSSIPVAATLVGGPVVGAAVWAANKVLSPAVNAMTAYKYSITGTWKNPVIKKL